MLAKKPKSLPKVTTTLSSGLPGTSVDDLLTIATGTAGSVWSGSAYSTAYDYGTYSIASTSGSSTVSIDTNGVTMEADCDIKIGERSLKDFIDSVEQRLGILRPNPELEDKWANLKGLRQAYMDLEREIIEKEKMWKILKDS